MLNNIIMESSITDLEKSRLLAEISEEVPFNPSLTKMLSQLENLGYSKNLNGIEDLLKNFIEDLKTEFKNVLNKQIQVYKSAEIP